MGVEVLVVTVNVEEPAPLIEVGLKFAEAPEGNPIRLRAMLPLKLPSAVVLTVYVVLPPAGVVCEPGEAEIVKSAALTTSVTLPL